MACGNPFKPSTTAINRSSRPRFFSFVMTRSQNLAPSVCLIQIPRMSLVLSARTPSARYTALFLTVPSSPILARRASKNTSGYIASSGRFCHSVTSSMTSPVMVEIRSAFLDGDQLCAIADFAYNLGTGRLKSSTLRRKLNAGDIDGATDELRKW